MKKAIAFLMIFTLLFAFCACGGTTVDPTTASDEAVTPGNAAEVTPDNVTDITAQSTDEFSTSAAQNELPVLENYTLVADETKNKNNFVFTGTKEDVLTCNKAVIINSDGTTEMAFSFAEDGSAITMQSVQPGGNKYSALIEFDEQGRVTGVFNGSGTYSTYEYTDNTCLLQAFYADGVLHDQRTYFYDENDRTQRIERADSIGVYETYVYSYNEDGTTANLLVENETGKVLYEYGYDENKNLISTRIEQNGSFYALQEFTYDANGKRVTQSVRMDENASTVLDSDYAYTNEYAADGTYLGTIQTDTAIERTVASAAYGYVTTQYPHYADFINEHFMTY
ncbi:MAG: hypothetical protein E7523_02795 [Ruminococcaceae bacterium]|nr:hypothetical protein [Oscillospiraceae bacterium]